MRCSNCNATLLDCSKYCHICGQRTEKVTRSEMTMLQVYSRWLPQHQKRVGSATIYREDAVTNSISYDFDIVAGTSPSKFRVVFECKPLEEGRASVSVVYDDSVSASWDASGTIKYVEKKEDGAEG